MKKNNKKVSTLLFSTERVRDLQPLDAAQLTVVAGAGMCGTNYSRCPTSGCGGTGTLP